MTMVWLESFDNWVDGTWLQVRYDGLNPTTLSTRTGRFGGNAIGSDAVSGTQFTLIVPGNDEYTVGLAFRMTGTADTATGDMAIRYRLAGSGDQITLRVTSAGPNDDEWRLEVRRGGLTGTVLATQTQAQHQGVWHFVEFQALANTTTGSYEVRLDGVALAELTDSGINTAGSGSNNIDRVDIFIHQTADMDDIYVLNDLGSANNDFLGVIHVEGIRPDGDGNQSDWTPSSGTDHWVLVDEPGGGSLGTDYVETSTLNDVDLFTYGNLARITGASVTIPAVQLDSMMALSAAGSEGFHHTFRSGGMEHDAGGQTVTSTSQDNFLDVFETNLAETKAWNVADLNAIEFGVEKQ